MQCPDGYQDIAHSSKYCYKSSIVATEQMNWEEAKNSCKEENGELACFGSKEEAEILADFCEGCWAGYKWEIGKR